MNANDFQTQATVWIGAVVVIIGLLMNAYFNLKNQWETRLHKQQIDQNTARLNGQSAKIDTLFLSAQSPNQPSVNVAFAEGNKPAEPIGEGG